jgi:hypothetical protein
MQIKRAARVILDTDRTAKSVPLFNKLKWLPFYEEAIINIHCRLYRRIHGEAPEYMLDMHVDYK